MKKVKSRLKPRRIELCKYDDESEPVKEGASSGGEAGSDTSPGTAGETSRDFACICTVVETGPSNVEGFIVGPAGRDPRPNGRR